MGDRSGASGEKKGQPRSPVLEWIFGGVGLVLTLAMLGFIGWQAVTQGNGMPPWIEVRVDRVAPAGDAYVVEIVARNRSPRTAKGVEVEGVLAPPGGESETSSVTFDFIPGGSSVRGGLHFSSDPAAGDLQLRTLGHSHP